MRYRLRTLLILLAVGPPLLGLAGWFAWDFYVGYNKFMRSLDKEHENEVNEK